MLAASCGAHAAQADPVAACDAAAAPSVACAEAYVFAGMDARHADSLDRAEALARKAIDQATRFPGDRAARRVVLGATSEFAAIYARRGRLRDSEEQYRRALALAEALNGQRSVEVLLALLGLSQNLLAQERWADAEKIARGGVEIDRVTDYELKPVLSISLLNNLAVALLELNRLDEAETATYELAERQYKKLSEQFGVRRRDIDDLPALLRARAADPQLSELRGTLFQAAMLLNNLGIICRRRGDSADCIELLEESARFRTALLPEWPIQLADSWSNLSPLYRDAGRVADAVASIERALSTYRTILGPLHPYTSAAEADLGALQLYHAGQPLAARASLRRSAAGLLEGLKVAGASSETTDRLRQRGHVFRNLVVASWRVAHRAGPD